MATVTITIHTDNAAFEDDPWGEVAYILESIAENMTDEQGLTRSPLIDRNGNTCGSVSIKEN